jgi:hypothetical protein
MELQASRGAELFRVDRDRLIDVQGGVAGPSGVILLIDRSSEEGHDPVPGELVDRSSEATHAIGEQLDEAVHDRGPYFGVEVLLKIHRSLDVGKENRQLLRSPSGSPAAGTCAAGERPGITVNPAARDVPHSPQKRSPGSTAPQRGQVIAKGAPHQSQNLRPSRFSRPQPAQMGLINRRVRPAVT